MIISKYVICNLIHYPGDQEMLDLSVNSIFVLILREAIVVFFVA